MLPSLVSRSVKSELRSFISNNFPMVSKTFTEGSSSILDAFLEKDENFAKGPWAQVSLPFRMVQPDKTFTFEFFSTDRIIPGFVPYEHQRRAFEKLSYRHPVPKSVLIATGTGSGKTESFLFPIIDYCLSTKGNGGKKGIKAIIVYPMNALAADQERRLADLLDKCKSNKLGEVTAAIYTGDSNEKYRDQTSEHLVRERRDIRDNPPDILLTNYRMLDLLLLREKDQPIWDKSSPELLRYLVVDELHTFDGAQGTDLACLIRRLRGRLSTGGNELRISCIGTSATIGTDVEGLCDYASNIFATTFEPDCVIQEDRLSPREFIESCRLDTRSLVYGFPPDLLPMQDGETSSAYISRVVKAWFGESLGLDGVEVTEENQETLGKRLPSLMAFQRLLNDFQDVQTVSSVAEKWIRTVPSLRQLGERSRNEEELRSYVENLIDSLLALVSLARTNKRPFLQVRSQLWMRQLSRVVSPVGEKTKLVLAADLNASDTGINLPLIGCRECNAVGWLTSIPQDPVSNVVRLNDDTSAIYRAWFGHEVSARLLYPITSLEEYQAINAKETDRRIHLHLACPKCGVMRPAAQYEPEDIFAHLSGKRTAPKFNCACGSEKVLCFWVPQLPLKDIEGGGKRIISICPHCKADDTLHIFGLQTATIGSVAFESVYNSPFTGDCKAIAFSDSVQDAAHKAGFLQSRSGKGIVRTAISAYLKRNGIQEIGFLDLIGNVPRYWVDYFKEAVENTSALSEEDKKLLASRPETRDILAKASFLATFVQPDLQSWAGWNDFERAGSGVGVNERGEPVFSSPLETLAKTFKGHNGWENLFDFARQNLSWEVLTEFGKRSLVGKSLFRTGAATVCLDAGKINDASEKLAALLNESFERTGGQIPLQLERDAGVEPVTTGEARLFLIGLLEKMRQSGAFSVEDFDLESIKAPLVKRDYTKFLNEGSYYFPISAVLPNYGKYLHPPVPLTINTKNEHRLTVENNKFEPKSWFECWLGKVLYGDQKYVSDNYKDIYQEILTFLTTQGILFSYRRERAEYKDQWVIDTKKLKLTTKTSRWRCSSCGRKTLFPLEYENVIEGMPCMDAKCGGKLKRLQDSPRKYASFVGNELVPVRISSAEHTSIVDAKKREQAERSFSSSSAPWSLNLLSATSTLEMGIDVGKLSTVMQFSVPATPANYIQRIGRAGRKDGNSLALTISAKDVHSQYFWEDPEKMIKAPITPPGVFLKAVAVLERQAVAYALTSWITSVRKATVPAALGEVLSNRKRQRGENGGENKEKSNLFPSGFLNWSKENSKAIAGRFIGLFDADGRKTFDDETRIAITKFIEGESYGGRPGLIDAVERVLNKAEEMDRRRNEDIKRLTSRINELKKKIIAMTDGGDPAIMQEIADAAGQKDQIQEMLRDFRRTETFRFLTDEGILPNYAFPEEGVMVDGMIVRYRGVEANRSASGNKEKKPIPALKFAFIRPAEQALGDVFPGNDFYALSHRLHVDQVRMDETSIEQWRFCEDCSYAEKVDASKPVPANCPRCCSDRWSDVGRVRDMLRMKEMVAHAESKSDYINDNKEEREKSLTVREVFVVEDPDSVENAWKLTDKSGDFAFGFEFLKSATVREINFGKATGNAPKFYAAGRSIPSAGFKICSECGMIFKGEKEKRMRHDYSCKYRGKSDDREAWIRVPFLYRELKSEALRIQIPVFEKLDPHFAAQQIESLSAAIRLGLKKYFKGNVDHLRLTVQSEPNADAEEGRNWYIIIYDSIPGGSGYLKELAKAEEDNDGRKPPYPEVMRQVFKLAYEAVAYCDCEDGCYKCLFQYRDYNSRKLISKSIAVDLLARIDNCFSGTVVPMPDEGDDITLPVQSVLEELFVRKLTSLDGVSVSKNRNADGTNSYDIRFKLDDRARENFQAALNRGSSSEFLTWTLRSQVPVTDRGGLNICIPDFTIEPKNSNLLRNIPFLRAHIFTDGWEHHKDILSDDSKKRQELLNEKTRVWSLTWQDIANVGASEDQPDVGLDLRRFMNEDHYKTADQGYRFFGNGNDPAESLKRLEEPYSSKKGNFWWLVSWLRDPIGFAKEARSAVVYAGLTGDRLPKGTKVAPCLERVPEAEGEGGKSFCLRTTVDEEIYLGYKFFMSASSETLVGACIRLDESRLENSGASNRESEELRELWARYWRYANLTQFLDKTFVCTDANQSYPCYDPALFYEMELPEESDKKWAELSKEYGEDTDFYGDAIDAIDKMRRAGIPFPDETGVEGLLGGQCEPFSKPTGNCWFVGEDSNRRTVYLFIGQDVFGVLPEPDGKTRIILTTDEDWLELLKAELNVKG